YYYREGPVIRLRNSCYAALILSTASLAAEVRGRVLDPQGRAVPAATISVRIRSYEVATTATDFQGEFSFGSILPGEYRLFTHASGFQDAEQQIAVAGVALTVNISLPGIAGQHDSVVITGKSVEPAIDLRNAEVFNRTLFSRDDQLIQQLD